MIPPGTPPSWATFLTVFPDPSDPQKTPDQDLASFFARRQREWVLAPARAHYDRELNPLPGHPREPNHLTTLMILACSIEALAGFHAGPNSKDVQRDKIAKFLRAFGRSDWSSRIPPSDLAARVSDNWRNGLAHGLRIRGGDEFISGQDFQGPAGALVLLEGHPQTGLVRAVFNTPELIEEFIQTADRFLVALESPSRQPRWLKAIRKELAK